MMVSTALIVGLLAGFVAGLCTGAMVYLRARSGSPNDSELLDALEENGWYLGFVNGQYAVLGGVPQRVIGLPNEDVREVLTRALELVEAGVVHGR